METPTIKPAPKNTLPPSAGARGRTRQPSVFDQAFHDAHESGGWFTVAVGKDREAMVKEMRRVADWLKVTVHIRHDVKDIWFEVVDREHRQPKGDAEAAA